MCRQDDYISVARDHGYDLADRMQSVEGSGQLSADRQKIVADLLRDQKKSSNTTSKPKQKFTPYPTIPGPVMLRSPFQAGNVATVMLWHHMIILGFQHPAINAMNYGAMAPQMIPNLPYPRMPTTNKVSKKVNKSKSTCHACQGVGHWVSEEKSDF